MNPQCQNCGQIVSIGKGQTTEIRVKKKYVDIGSREAIYLCKRDDCKANVERFRTHDWYESDRLV